MGPAGNEDQPRPVIAAQRADGNIQHVRRCGLNISDLKPAALVEQFLQQREPDPRRSSFQGRIANARRDELFQVNFIPTVEGFDKRASKSSLHRVGKHRLIAAILLSESVRSDESGG